MQIIYLKAGNQSALETALEDAGITSEGILASPRYLLDIIGEISIETGETVVDDEGREIPVTRVVNGFHANLALRWPETTTDPEEEAVWLSPEAEAVLDPITMPAPATPIREWT